MEAVPPLRAMHAAAALLTIALLGAALSCGADPATTPATPPASTPAPRQVLEHTSALMSALDTASFTLEHEGEGTSQLFAGVDLLRVEGQVDLPDRFKLTVEAKSRFPRSFFSVDVVVIGGTGDTGWLGASAYMTDFIHTERWTEVPPGTLPFNFFDLGRTLSDIVLSIEEPAYMGSGQVGGVPSLHLGGVVQSESLEILVPAADPGYMVGLEVWVGRDQGLLRKVRIAGPVRAEDEPDVVRVLTIYDFDKPVEISRPRTG